MLVYEGLKKDFLYSVESDKIAEEIENSILKKLGRHTGESEFNSWIHSMEYMYKVLNDDAIPENAGIAIANQKGGVGKMNNRNITKHHSLISYN